MQELCLRDDAQRATRGLTSVSSDVVDICIRNATHWRHNEQLIRTCKPLVDAIGNVETRDANLADCMLELLWAERAIAKLSITETDDVDFAYHAKSTVRHEFHRLNTDIHWLALFLHPLCRRLAISSATHSRKLTDACRISLDLAQRWKWPEEAARQLLQDLKSYQLGNAPFAGGISNARTWWESLLVRAKEHPIKALAIRIFSIVPHCAEVERLFSNLGGVQSVKRCNWTVDHIQTIGTLRNNYESELTNGATVHRRHAHMHTRDERGLNKEKATELLDQWSFQSPTTAPTADTEGPKTLSPEEVAEEFERFEAQQHEDEAREVRGGAEGRRGDGLRDAVGVDAVYAVEELAEIRKGVAPKPVQEEVNEHDNAPGNKQWSTNDLLRSVGLS